MMKPSLHEKVTQNLLKNHKQAFKAFLLAWIASTLMAILSCLVIFDIMTDHPAEGVSFPLGAFSVLTIVAHLLLCALMIREALLQMANMKTLRKILQKRGVNPLDKKFRNAQL